MRSEHGDLYNRTSRCTCTRCKATANPIHMHMWNASTWKLNVMKLQSTSAVTHPVPPCMTAIQPCFSGSHNVDLPVRIACKYAHGIQACSFSLGKCALAKVWNEWHTLLFRGKTSLFFLSFHSLAAVLIPANQSRYLFDTFKLYIDARQTVCAGLFCFRLLAWPGQNKWTRYKKIYKVCPKIIRRHLHAQ